MSLEQMMKERGMHTPKPEDKGKKVPLWKGPEKDGITFSLINKYLTDKERFRIYTFEGLAQKEEFNHRLEYGNMWHLCEEYTHKQQDWQAPLKSYCQKLCAKYQYDREHIEKWYNVCRTQYPIYLKHWQNNNIKNTKTEMLSEYSFKEPISLPSGRTVWLRGKFDSVYLMSTASGETIWLQENKTKGDINVERIESQLKFDCQTMIYMIALAKYCKRNNIKSNIGGVIYNVVRRPLSGGKHSIVRHKPSKKNPMGESQEEFNKRLGEAITEDATFFFMRWRVRITIDDMINFLQKCLYNLLDEICAWYDLTLGAYESDKNLFEHNRMHYVTPYGLYNPLSDDGKTEYDNYVDTGNSIGLEKRKTVFPELD